MDKTVKQKIEYWLKSSKHDFKTMEGLFRIKRYSDSLFFGHIVLEKILKALVVQNIKDNAPATHNLIVLSQIANLKFNKKELELLALVNRFNIRSRYPDEKLKFYKICDYKFTKNNLDNIKNFYQKLCQKLRLKK